MRRSARRSILLLAVALAPGMDGSRPAAAADGTPPGQSVAPAQTASQRKLGATISACVEKPSVDCAREMLRLGLRAGNLDPAIRREAVEALRGMSGEKTIGRFLLQTVDREWQRGDTEMVTALALALLPVEGSDVARGILAGLDRRMAASPQAAAVVTGIVAMAARQPDATGVVTLSRIAELDRFRSDFAFRRGLIHALIAIRRPEAVDLLIRMLATLPGEARMDVGRHLAAISGQQHGLDAAAWSRWWQDARDGFVFPERSVLPAHATIASGTTGSYYDIPLSAQSLVFVIDTSGSMEGPRLAAAQRELVEAIAGLAPSTRFNIVGFGSRAYAWQERLVTADPEARQSASSFVERLVAEGRTATSDALDAAFRFDVEAIFLLSDGEPTAGKVVDPAAIARLVAETNQVRRISVYTIGVLPEPPLAEFLRGLADQNFGCYLQVDQ